MAKRKTKSYRRQIRINGVLINSPSFAAKAQADAWFAQKKQEKQFIKFGFLSGSVPTFLEYSAGWMQKRIASYPKSTSASDEQRLRTYLLPYLSQIPMDKITRQKMRDVLNGVIDAKQSIATRKRVTALASKIFNDALNENPPLITVNPVTRLQFDDPRRGRKRHDILEDQQEIQEYLKCAASISSMHFVIAALGLMGLLRKSEKIALKWGNLKERQGILRIEAHCEQVSLTIKPGTKAGSDESRDVHVPVELIQVLLKYKSMTKFNSPGDYVLCDKEGEWIRPRQFHNLVKEIHKKFGRKITDHTLRHSGSALFAGRTGNLQALQQQLGHANISTTQIYSELSGSQMKPFGEATSVKVNDDEDTSGNAK